MKIVLIGPTYPFRGGIAHYTTLLCRALRKICDVKFISFRRQYPKLLFPGESDRDPSKNPIMVNDVNYVIDSLNFLTWIVAVRAIIRYKPEKIVFPWWVSFWMPHFLFIATMTKHYCGSEVVFICHNVIEHESNFIKKMATMAVLSKADRLITHSKEETSKIKTLMGGKVNVTTAFHPTYKDFSSKRYTKSQAKKMLGLTGDVLLFFGFVREYKGLGVLLDALPMIIKEKDVTLLVVGEFWQNKNKYLERIDRYKLHPHIRIIDKYIPNEEIGIYFACSDLVVQPYISASGSGVCQLAFGFDRPVIGTNVGSLPELVEDGVNGRLVSPGSANELAAAIIESLEPETLYELSVNAKETKHKFSWDIMANIVSKTK